VAKAKQKNVNAWKKKKFYTILAPSNFDEKELGSTVSADPGLLKGRTIQTSLAELMDDRRKQHLKITFEIDHVEKDKAYTKFKKFMIPVGYLRYKVRKDSTKVDVASDITFENEKLRLKAMVLSRYKLSEPQRKEISAIAKKHLSEYSKKTPEQVLQLTLFGKLGTEVYKECRKIAPINRVEAYHIERL